MNDTRDTLRATPLAEPSIAALDAAIESATEALVSRQNGDGHWVFALEADVTIPSEYILLMHYLDEIDLDLQASIARYIRKTQGADGGWPLFHAGPFDISATVKAYYALKLAGDDIQAPHMVRARETILGAGGAARCNVFTRIALALFAQVPWRAVPVMPVEIMSLPKWFPFHLNKVSYWSRTVIVPLLILMTLKPQAKNPNKIDVAELFVTPPFELNSATCIRRPGISGRPRSAGSIMSCASPSRPSRRRAGRRRSSARWPSPRNASTAKTAWAPSSRPWQTR